jgi:hypothetical protein
MVRYLPKKRSEIQPPRSGKKYTPATKTWKISLASLCASAAGNVAKNVEARKTVRMLRIP